MESRKRRMAKITAIFVALETIFLYYVIGLFYLSRIPGTPFQYFPGLSYIIKTFFPIYWEFNYNYGPGRIITSQQRSTALVQFHNGELFILGFWYGLIIAAILTAVVYFIKFRNSYKMAPRARLQGI